jgi:hypothetical protein
MQFSTLWYLQRLNLFEEFTQAELLRVARTLDMEELEKHEGVFQIGDPAGNVYFLIEGLVKIYRRGPSGWPPAEPKKRLPLNWGSVSKPSARIAAAVSINYACIPRPTWCAMPSGMG